MERNKKPQFDLFRWNLDSLTIVEGNSKKYFQNGMKASALRYLRSTAERPGNEVYKNNKFRILICNGRLIDQKMSRIKLKIKHLKKGYT